jgi:hypothetical protein
MGRVVLVQGNPTEVKVVLASVATALAIYQLVLAAIGYRKLRIGLEDGALHAVTVFLLLAATWASTAGGVPGMTRQLIGPTSQAELDAREERLERQEERREDRENR